MRNSIQDIEAAVEQSCRFVASGFERTITTGVLNVRRTGVRTGAPSAEPCDIRAVLWPTCAAPMRLEQAARSRHVLRAEDGAFPA